MESIGARGTAADGRGRQPLDHRNGGTNEAAGRPAREIARGCESEAGGSTEMRRGRRGLLVPPAGGAGRNRAGRLVTWTHTNAIGTDLAKHVILRHRRPAGAHRPSASYMPSRRGAT